jgi:TolB protein
MNADGSEPKNLTNHPAQDNYATWSPDGKKIAFVSNRIGGHDVYVMEA